MIIIGKEANNMEFDSIDSLNKLIDIIFECIEKVRISEGIKVDPFRNVSYDKEHENYVDTSTATNPTYTKKIIKGITVYSIFQRKQSPEYDDKSDGNPLLYAMKREKGYHFNPKKDYMIFCRLIGDIVDNFIKDKSGRFGTTIVLPSTNELNMTFANIVKGKIRNTKIIDDLIFKMTVEEVRDCIGMPNSPFYQRYGRSKKDFSKALHIFDSYCKGMKDGYFRFHLIKDLDMRKVITQTMKLNPASAGSYADAINEKDILLLDDSITNGNSMNEAIKIIRDNYAPKSITVLTLMSPLYTYDGKRLVRH